MIANGQAVAAALSLDMITTAIKALLVGKPVPFGADGEASTIGSRLSAQKAVWLTLDGFEGDKVGDPTVHGGADKAVHFYPGEHYAAWQADFVGVGRDPHPHLGHLGGFGENISALEMTEGLVQIGDRFRLGAALVEISQGRQPCWKIDHHFGMKGMTAAVIKTGRSGYYFRILEEGLVEPDATIEQVERARHGWTVERCFQLLIGGFHRAAGAEAALRELAELDVLAASWRQRAVKLLG